MNHSAVGVVCLYQTRPSSPNLRIPVGMIVPRIVKLTDLGARRGFRKIGIVDINVLLINADNHNSMLRNVLLIDRVVLA